MLVRDWYIHELEKRAAEGAEDSAETAHKGLSANQGDQVTDLKGLFSHAGEVEKTESKFLRQNFPRAKKAEGTTSSSTLLKVAMNRGFFDALRETGFMKLADPEYLRVAFQGFEDEIGKIAGVVKLPASAMGKVEGFLAKATKGWKKPIGSSGTPKGWPQGGTKAAIRGI